MNHQSFHPISDKREGFPSNSRHAVDDYMIIMMWMWIKQHFDLMSLSMQSKPNQTRWVSLKLLWKVSPPVNRRLNLGFTGFSSKQTISPLR